MNRDLIRAAEHAIVQIERAAFRLASEVRTEARRRETRDARLDFMVNQLIGQPNPLTEKPHSATSAEKAVKDTDEYKALNTAVIDGEMGRILALGKYEATVLAAKLAVAVVAGDAVPQQEITGGAGMPLRVDPLQKV